MIRPSADSNRSFPVPEISSAAWRRACGKVSAGSALNRLSSSSWPRTHSSSGCFRRCRRELAEAAARITDTELDVLLDDGGWRERKTAAWFIAVSGRTRFRDKVGALLLAGEGPNAGRAYCVALTRLGTEADAAHTEALGALLCLDESLGTDHAVRFLEPHGLWWQCPKHFDTLWISV